MNSHVVNRVTAASDINRRVTPAEIAATVSAALAAGLLGPEDDAVSFYDIDRLLSRIAELKAAFPRGSLHTVAVKANPTVALLRLAAGAGMGVEAASRGELALADAAGVNESSVVFDSPAKTEREIRDALSRSLLLNANSRAELLRIARLSRESRARIGIRVNPTIGAGAIDHTSTATLGSKFGVPIDSVRSVVAEYRKAGGRLDALHVHVGSQGMSLDQLVSANATVYDLFVELRATNEDLSILDIGGGLPVAYSGDQDAPSHADYALALRDRIPGLWSGDVAVVTEFGRSIHANNGWVASRIEYVLTDESRHGGTIVTHVGADLFVRAAYRPEAWHHEVLVVSADGELLTGDTVRYSVAGPLCFSGDYIARDVQLPITLSPGDYLIVRDTGAYTSAMWSVYNSRQIPKSLGYGACAPFVTLTRQEPLETVVERWTY